MSSMALLLAVACRVTRGPCRGRALVQGRASCLPYVPEAQGSSGACWGRRVGTLHVEAACLWPSGKEQGPGVPGPDMDRIRTGGNA